MSARSRRILGVAALFSGAHLLAGVSLRLTLLFTALLLVLAVVMIARRSFRRRSLLQGIAWGLFLEFFQLTLYPGVAGHVIFDVIAWILWAPASTAMGSRFSPSQFLD